LIISDTWFKAVWRKILLLTGEATFKEHYYVPIEYGWLKV
jgi:hypothetical protein